MANLLVGVGKTCITPPPDMFPFPMWLGYHITGERNYQIAFKGNRDFPGVNISFCYPHSCLSLCKRRKRVHAFCT